MEEKNKREEIQSRREFFKKAAKAALPVIGAAILSSVPFIDVEASESGCRSCGGGCSHGCGTTCYTNCQGYTHKYHPSGDCDTCRYYCAGCTGECSGTCSGSCLSSAY